MTHFPTISFVSFKEASKVAQRIKDIFLGKDSKRKTLMEAFREHNEMMKSRVGIDFAKSTFTRYKTTEDHISEFLRHHYNLSDIHLIQIKYSFITDLKQWYSS